MYYGETDDTPAFPDILAVDPRGCGCNECATGEYVNEDTYTERATKGDLLRLINGEVGLNTYSDNLGRFIFWSSFDTDSARKFTDELQEWAVKNYTE
jgi:hypothetical protein